MDGLEASVVESNVPCEGVGELLDFSDPERILSEPDLASEFGSMVNPGVGVVARGEPLVPKTGDNITDTLATSGEGSEESFGLTSPSMARVWSRICAWCENPRKNASDVEQAEGLDTCERGESRGVGRAPLIDLPEEDVFVDKSALLSDQVSQCLDLRSLQSFAVRTYDMKELGPDGQLVFKQQIEQLMALDHPCLLKIEGCCLPKDGEGAKVVTKFMWGGFTSTNYFVKIGTRGLGSG